MAQLVFRCPYTNKPIPSGIEVHPDNLKSMRLLPLRLQCPHCGLHHDG